MADPNKIRLFPIDPNALVASGNTISLECDPFVPAGFVPKSPIGGSDIKEPLTILQEGRDK